jgi:hypothetical protein
MTDDQADRLFKALAGIQGLLGAVATELQELRQEVRQSNLRAALESKQPPPKK